MAHRPLPLTVLGALQFAAFAVGCVVLLGDGTLDGELSAGDIALAVAVALVGAVVVGSTWSGAKTGWWLQLALALATVAWGAIQSASGSSFGYVVLVGGVVWFVLAALPQSRAWFLRPVP